MNQVLYSIEDVKKMIADGQHLLLAGDEKALSQLPAGSWIAGSIPYFMGEEGGEFSQEKIYVTTLPEFADNIKIQVYDESTIEEVYNNAPEHGFSVIIISALSKTHEIFSLKAPTFSNFATQPLIGWISGVSLDELGKTTPKVYDGTTAKAIENGAVVLSASLPKNKTATLDIINMFKPGSGDSLYFEEDGFSATDVVVNGKKQNFVDYIKSNNIDTKPPLVANMHGAHINTSFQAINEEEKRVDFYAPVFKSVEYKLAEPVEDYVQSFTGKMSENLGKQIYFSCNCILNYLYSELEGKKTGNVTGPITFGEVAYQLLNQTMAYMIIEDI